MSYSSKKGYRSEKELEKFLDSIFNEFGYSFERRGGQERFKKTQAGDVVPAKKGSILDEYFLEAKCQSNARVFEWLFKAEDDAELSGRRGAILFATQQKKGEHGRDCVVMTRKTFSALLKELQGFREQETK